VIYHATVRLEALGIFKDEITYDEYLADFAGEFYDLLKNPGSSTILDPNSYKASQRLAVELLEKGSPGIVCPSVHATGVCLVCFRPALVTHVRKGRTFRFRWSGNPRRYPTPRAFLHGVTLVERLRHFFGMDCASRPARKVFKRPSLS
jgi:hypothetical protein